MQILNSKYGKVALILSIIAVPIIIYFYFLTWKTLTICADDVNIYTSYIDTQTLYEKINLPLISGKYRPIQGLSVTFLIGIFQKNLIGYYIFNVAIQTLIAFSFALIINLFLRSPIYSLFISLTIGLSRFSLWNITQLLNGGALEGLAMLFFLLSLYFLLQVLVVNNFDSLRKQNGIILSIVFANLCLYTHERYIIIIPFIILIVLCFPNLQTLRRKQKLSLILFALGSIILNVIIKKYIYDTPFFVGTGGTNISLSVSNIFQFLMEGILSIIQINTGPEHQVGIPFSDLPVIDQALALLLCISLMSILLLYLLKFRKLFALRRTVNHLLLLVSKKHSFEHPDFFIFLSLIALFILTLVPVVVTITLDQRFLQAPYSIFILLVVIAMSSLQFRKSYIKNVLFSIIIILLIWTDYNYLSKGSNKIYFIVAEEVCSVFKKGIDNENVRPTPDNLYIWEKKKNPNIENAFRWYLIEGKFFALHQNKSKKIFFIDSTDTRLNLDKESDQVIYVGSKGIIDLTDFYLQDSMPQYLR